MSLHFVKLLDIVFSNDTSSYVILTNKFKCIKNTGVLKASRVQYEFIQQQKTIECYSKE